MFTVIVGVENNRVSKFSEFADKADADAHVEKFGGVVYEGKYQPTLYVDKDEVSIVEIEKTKEQIKTEALTKIDEIERNSLRAMREALLTNDKSTLLAIEAEIVAEREKLKTAQAVKG